MKKLNFSIFLAALLTIALLYTYDKEEILQEIPRVIEQLPGKLIEEVEPQSLEVPKLVIDHDEDGDGTKDLEDILVGARKDAANKPAYRSAYYRGGYPPEDEGVCTDVIWRAFAEAGYNLKDLVDADIKENPSVYPRIQGRPDPNIDFRRVPNLIVFFNRHATVLTTEVSPGDVAILQEWQGGDIVVFGKPYDHIAIVSDRRRSDGVPYLIHNGGPYTKEEDTLLYWHQFVSPITHHFRWPKVE